MTVEEVIVKVHCTFKSNIKVRSTLSKIHTVDHTLPTLVTFSNIRLLQISPVILNTVMTITAAMTTKSKDEQSEQTNEEASSLWSVMNIYSCNYWFLGVDTASEVTESFRDQDGSNMGESFTVDVKVVQVTMESGLGHRTVPLLLAESSFSGTAKNWSSLLHLNADMTLEVRVGEKTEDASHGNTLPDTLSDRSCGIFSLLLDLLLWSQ